MCNCGQIKTPPLCFNQSRKIGLQMGILTSILFGIGYIMSIFSYCVMACIVILCIRLVLVLYWFFIYTAKNVKLLTCFVGLADLK